MRRIERVVWVAIVLGLVGLVIGHTVSLSTTASSVPLEASQCSGSYTSPAISLDYADITGTASGYVVDAPNVEGQIYIENPDGSTTIVLGDE